MKAILFIALLALFVAADDGQTIWTYLYNAIGNKYGVAGLMGNLQAESGLRSNNVQDTFERRVGSDSSYTSNVDNGSISKYSFSHDSAGYGLAQWTYYTRKQGLYEYAKNKGVSIGNLNMQLEYLVQELKTSFGGVWNTLRNASSIRQASDSVLLNFENPTDHGYSVQNYRGSLSQQMYDKYSSSSSYNPSTPTNPTTPTTPTYGTRPMPNPKRGCQLTGCSGSYCCSYWGYCGLGNAYCGLGNLQCACDCNGSYPCKQSGNSVVTTPSTPVVSTPSTSSIYIQAYDSVYYKWLGEVKDNNDYAGIFGHPITNFRARVSNGNIYYRCHIYNGGWSAEYSNGSSCGGKIDAIMMRTTAPGKKVSYQVHYKNGGWLGWVTGYNTNDHNYGYAGWQGRVIDGIRAKLI